MLPNLEDKAAEILLTAGTLTGLEFLRGEAALRFGHREKSPRVRVEMAPFDHLPHVGKFLDGNRVAVLCLYEVEIWPHYLRACRERNIPVLLAAARLSSRAYARLRPFTQLYARLLGSLDFIQTQSEADTQRFQALGVKPPLGLETGADFRLLHYLQRASATTDAGKLPGLPGQGRGFAFISLHLAELRILLPTLRAFPSQVPVWVFPRLPQELNRFRKLLHPLGFRDFSGDSVEETLDPNTRLGRETLQGPRLLVCRWGMVSPLLTSCYACFVGGSLIGRGCHNLWEPWLAGLRICFGPSLENQETPARFLLETKEGVIVRSPDELNRYILSMLPFIGRDRLNRSQVDFPEGMRIDAQAANKRFGEVVSRAFAESTRRAMPQIY